VFVVNFPFHFSSRSIHGSSGVIACLGNGHDFFHEGGGLPERLRSDKWSSIWLGKAGIQCFWPAGQLRCWRWALKMVELGPCPP